eukprot:1604688-Amphidinium_carterae.1
MNCSGGKRVLSLHQCCALKEKFLVLYVLDGRLELCPMQYCAAQHNIVRTDHAQKAMLQHTGIHKDKPSQVIYVAAHALESAQLAIGERQ